MRPAPTVAGVPRSDMSAGPPALPAQLSSGALAPVVQAPAWIATAAWSAKGHTPVVWSAKGPTPAVWSAKGPTPALWSAKDHAAA